MVSTSEVVCNTSTPRDRYFSLEVCGVDILEDSVSEPADDQGVFRMDRKEKKENLVQSEKSGPCSSYNLTG